jgi:hypothetical protein
MVIGWQLAQLNVGRLRAPLDDPSIADFVAALDRVNALAEASPGFVWRLQGAGGNATDIRVEEDPLLIVNMSVWDSLEALFDFTYRTGHNRILARRRDWFAERTEAHLVLWWVPEGHRQQRFPAPASTPAVAAGR